ncbi:hypothetical protein [Microbulbifer pacificus]|uniref:Uncharacterized protein n=1 Tax=Microbulbifer pacificus TaxID=407164 RepID=A0AAU0MY53_9GAMM|nr:hypothetical protein [Microbulbifer pacificus]WOX04933.1 hypothetical protein R5R33_14475 [Microbulbifer pacificus]
MELSNIQKWFLFELQYFDMSLPLLLCNIERASPEVDEINKYEISQELVLTMNEKGLVDLYEIDKSVIPEYDLTSARAISGSELKKFICDSIRWVNQYSHDGKYRYAFATTEEGDNLIARINWPKAKK